MAADRQVDLILGADGFLGANLRAYFEAQGVSFIGVGKESGDFRELNRVLHLFSELPKLHRIFHVTTFQRTGPVQYEMPAELLTDNARIHLNILQAWKTFQPQAKLISTGSSCAYPESNEPISERMFQAGPLHQSVRGYGLAKQLLAVGSETYGTQYGLSWLHCILATVFGPHDHLEPHRSHFIGGMAVRAIREKREGKKIFSVWGGPDVVRECLYVEDQIEAILSAERHFENQIVNCAANASVTVGQVAAGIRDALNWDAEICYPEGTFQSTARKTLDSSVFLARTGWKPKYALQDGLELLLRDLQSRV